MALAEGAKRVRAIGEAWQKVAAASKAAASKEPLHVDDNPEAKAAG